jgi:hypothetical protein
MIVYEWAIEPVDEFGDVGEAERFDDCPTRDLEDNEQLVLVRDVIVGDSVASRSWAYVNDAGIDFESTHFSDTEKDIAKIPLRFVRALNYRQYSLSKSVSGTQSE